ncbi:MAG: hypothetical protein AB7O56_14770 [Bauldia sp.]
MRRALIAIGTTVAMGVQAPLAQMAAQDAFGAANDLCSAAIVADGPLTAAGDALRAAGWSVDYATNVGPEAQTLRASARANGQRGFYQAETDAAGGIFRLRCALEWQGFDGTLDLAGVAAAFGMEGGVTPMLDGGEYGTWSMELDEGLALYTAIHVEGYFLFQMIWVEWGAPRG